MRVSGFTFLRNAVLNGYPFEESIKSILPLVDEMVCAIGSGSDNTLARVRAMNDPKIRIIETSWNESMCDRGFVYGQQKMIAQFNCTGDWVFYLEGDEVVHELDLDEIYSVMSMNLNDDRVEALYFKFHHFYGTPWQIGIAGYRYAPRILRNSIRSIAPDGLFWLVLDKNKKGRYPRAKNARGEIYHYGHCRSIETMQSKLQQVGKYWGAQHPTFDGYGKIDPAELRVFSGVHPRVMADWLQVHAEHVFVPDASYRPTKRDYRNRVRFWLEETFKIELSKKHYTALD